MNYWEKRQQQLNQELEKDEKKLKKKLSSFYSAEYRKLEKEIAAYYSVYGEDKVIEYRKLMQNLDDADRERLIKRMQDFAQLYPEYADMLPIRESIYKLNRLEGLQMSILMQQLEIGAVDIKTVREHLVRQAVRNANQVAETMGYGKNFYSENSEIIRKIVNAKWYDGKDFSERIWGNVQKLARYLGTDIAAGFARGDSYNKLVSKLRQRFEKVSRNDAYRLIYTEGTFISNEARAVAFEQDTEEYVFRIQHYKARRSGWSDICDDLHEKRFKWSERKPGINFPPMHPWCHCTATPSVTDREKFIEDYEKRHGGDKKQAEKVANRMKEYSQGSGIGQKQERTILSRDEIVERAKIYGFELEQNPSLLKYDNGYPISNYLNKKLGYDKKPLVVSLKEFERLKAEGKTVLYRGVTDYNAISAHDMVEQFKNGKFYCGRGIYGYGTYTDTKKTVANYYAHDSGITQNGEVMEMVLSDDAKVVDYLEIFTEYEKLGIYKIIGEKPESYQDVLDNVGAYASIKGYDAISLNGFQNKNHVIILNRGKVIVKE